MQNGENAFIRDKIDSTLRVCFFFLFLVFERKRELLQFNVASTLLEKLLSVVHSLENFIDVNSSLTLFVLKTGENFNQYLCLVGIVQFILGFCKFVSDHKFEI